MIRVLSVDDHPLLRDGVAALIGNQTDMVLIAEASNGREALEQFRKHRPDITLMDLEMPGMSGIDAMSAIRGEFPDARNIVLTTLPAMPGRSRSQSWRTCLSTEGAVTKGTAGDNSRSPCRPETRLP